MKSRQYSFKFRKSYNFTHGEFHRLSYPNYVDNMYKSYVQRMKELEIKPLSFHDWQESTSP